MNRDLLLATLSSVLLLTGCDSSERIQHKMSIEVNTPEGLKTGSAVRESVYNRHSSFPLFLGEDRGSQKLRGEAVVVDLPDGQTLFALLTSSNGGVDFTARIPHYILGYGAEDNQADGPVIVWPPAHQSGVPMLVRFLDPEDPLSVEQVAPGDFESSFGDGYSLKSIVVQVTDQPVTDSIEGRMQKMDIKPGHNLDKDFKMSSNPTLAQKIGYKEFRKGLEQ